MKTLRLSYLLLCLACAFGCGRTAPASTSSIDITFEFWADDGARLFLDGQTLIDDWRPCAENTPGSHRIAKVTLTPGYHRIVAEYFNGESLDENDPDPCDLQTI